MTVEFFGKYLVAVVLWAFVSDVVNFFGNFRGSMGVRSVGAFDKLRAFTLRISLRRWFSFRLGFLRVNRLSRFLVGKEDGVKSLSLAEGGSLSTTWSVGLSSSGAHSGADGIESLRSLKSSWLSKCSS